MKLFKIIHIMDNKSNPRDIIALFYFLGLEFEVKKDSRNSQNSIKIIFKNPFKLQFKTKSVKQYLNGDPVTCIYERLYLGIFPLDQWKLVKIINHSLDAFKQLL